jgi:hypothetical protein
MCCLENSKKELEYDPSPAGLLGEEFANFRLDKDQEEENSRGTLALGVMKNFLRGRAAKR